MNPHLLITDPSGIAIELILVLFAAFVLGTTQMSKYIQFVDFVWKYYRGYSDTNVTVHVTKDNSLLHIKIRNSNSRDIPVFQNLNLIFDPEMRYGSKQNEKVINRGMLGDALKQILAIPYVLIHSSDDGTAFTNEQWNKPLIIRCNGKETHVRIIVDKAKQTYTLDIKEIKLVGDTDTDTEIEVFLPLMLDLDIHDIENFCRIYLLLTTDISFEFQLLDKSTEKPEAREEVQYQYVNHRLRKTYTGFYSDTKSCKRYRLSCTSSHLY